MKLKVKIKEKEYDVEIFEEKQGKVRIKIGDKEFLFEGKEEGKEEIPIPGVSFPKRNFSQKEIKAPLAGIVSEIFVKEGDFIKKDQKLLFLSAMKMENEIVSDFDGRVREVLVKKNQEVKEGSALIILQ